MDIGIRLMKRTGMMALAFLASILNTLGHMDRN